MNHHHSSRFLASVGGVAVLIAGALAACSTDSGVSGADAGGDGALGPDASVLDGATLADGSTSDATSPDGGTPEDAAQSSSDASDGGDGSDGTDAGQDADPGPDAGVDAGQDAGVDAGQDAGNQGGPPGYLYIGRFDTNDAAGARMAWPGTRIVAKFDGTSASATLTQANGFSGGPSWFNVIVDGVVGAPFSVAGVSQAYPLANGLGAGVHTVEIEKRTEANLGTVRFEGMTFGGGAGLLAPPARAARRIEFLADSTIDGFGIEGDRNVTCINSAPPQFDNARKSMSFVTAQTLGAEMVLNAYSGKGLQVDQDPLDLDTFPIIYPRTLPELGGSVWNFAVNVPDAVVISLGGTDLDGLSVAPAGFQAAYNALVGTVRGHYPNAYIWLTVWSQIKDLGPPNTRTAMTNVLNAVAANRAGMGDNKLFVYVFPEANINVDETGCYYHANAAHHAAMANLMVAEIKARTGW